MFKGTESLAPGEFSQIVARNGGNENAFTGADYTGYFQTIAKDRLELVMQMEADRMTNLVLDEQRGAARARASSWRSARSGPTTIPASPLARAAERRPSSYHHPYRLPVIGWRHEMASLHARGRARLLPDMVCAQQRRADRRRRHRRRGAAAAGREVLRRHPGAPGPGAASGCRSRRSRRRASRAQRPAGAAAVVAALLPGPELHRRRDASTPTRSRCSPRSSAAPARSRLYRSLVIEQKLATVGRRLLPRQLARPRPRSGIYASPRPGVTLDQLEAAVDAELQRLADEPITATRSARRRSGWSPRRSMPATA